MSVSEYDRPPRRVFFVDTTTAERRDFQHNPTQVEAQLRVAYARQVVPGLSHPHIQYTGTESFRLTLELFFSAVGEEQRLLNEDSLRFLLSLCHPITGEGPPRVLVFWPGLYSLTCVVEGYREAHVRFNAALKPLETRVGLELSEIRDVRLTTAEVRRVGALRASPPVGRVSVFV